MPDKPSGQPNKNSQASKPAKPRRRGWLRRVFRGLLVLLLILIVFYRPIVHTVARLVLVQVARREHLQLDVHFEGNVITQLIVKNVTAVPIGAGPNPVEKIQIETVNLQYSIPHLIKYGLGEFLRSYEIRNADLVFSPQPSQTKEESEQKKSVADTLNTVLGQPALYADRVHIENFNLRVNSPAGPDDTTELRGVNILFDPYYPGYLRIDRLKVPAMPAWEHIAAETSYAQRNLFVRDLRLAPEMVFDEINFDASQRAQDKGSMLVKGHFFGGTLALGVSGTKLQKKGENLQKSYDTAVHLEAAGIDAHAAAGYFHVKNPPTARLASLKVDYKGEPELPRTWNGNLAVQVEAIGIENAKIDRVSLQATFADGKAQITSAEVAAGKSTVALKGTAALPASINDFQKVEADASLTLDSPSLAELTAPFMPKPVEGTAKASGTVGLHAQKAVVDLSLSAAGLKFDEAGVEAINLKLNAAKALDQPQGAPPLQGLTAQVNTDLKNLSYATFTADSAGLEAAVKNEQITLKRFELKRAENSVTASGTYSVPESGKPEPPLNVEFSINAPRLESFGVGKDGVVLGGHLGGEGKAQLVNDVYNGSVKLDGGDFTYGDFKARKLTASVEVANNEANVDQVTLEIDEASKIAVTGKAGLKAPHTFEGAALVVIPKLSILQPLLATFGVKDPIDGAIDFSAEGQGSADKQDYTGQLKLALDRLVFGGTKVDEARLAASFFPGSAQTSEFSVKVGDTAFQAGIEWQENHLRLNDMVLRQGSLEVLKGYIRLPFELQQGKDEPPRDPKKWIGPIPLEKRIAGTLNAKDLDLEKLMATLPKPAPKTPASPLDGPPKPPVKGILNMNLFFAGTVLKPVLHLKLEGRKLYNPAMEKLDPAELDLTAHYSERELTLDVVARQKEIQPLTIKGHVPVDLESAITTHELDPNLPLDLTVKLPPTSLALIPRMVPAVRSAAGTVSIDAHVGGDVKTPRFSGAAILKLDYARMQSEGVPAIGKVNVNVAFTESTATLREFNGEIGGGTFHADGGAQFPNFTSPTFRLHLKADEVLVMRNDSVTVRIDSDIGLNGNMASSKLAGDVFVTHSRFFKDIDILPIALPGRPKTNAPAHLEPKSVASGGPPTLTLPAFLKDWTFDVGIKTRPNDPFKIVGNLANGAASIDLKFGGTGAEPWLDGTVRIDRLTASLPFSKLEITQGFITFPRDAFLQPNLDISAESQMRNYRINAFISGPATKPEVSLTSEPPLPQTDIISLLATGSTLSELSGSGDVLASKAAVLLFQSLYHKVFKNKTNPAEKLPMADRLDVDVGAADSKTGRQALSAAFKLNDQLFLVGDVDVTGSFTGRVKYLLRFR